MTIINQIKSKTKMNVGPLHSETGKFITGNKEMAKELNSYFASVFTKGDMNNVPEVLRETSFSEELKEITISR